MKRTVIVAGFARFGDYPVNPTEQLALQLDGTTFDGWQIRGVVMPPTYRTCHVELMKLAERIGAKRIISFGLATRIKRIKIEECGANWMSSRYTDAEGVFAEGEPLYPDEDSHFFTNTDSEQLAETLREAHVPVEVSHDAEGFVCNALIYQMMRAITNERLDILYAHLHTPWTDRNIAELCIPPDRAVIPWEMLVRAAQTAAVSLTRHAPFT